MGRNSGGVRSGSRGQSSWKRQLGKTLKGMEREYKASTEHYNKRVKELADTVPSYAQDHRTFKQRGEMKTVRKIVNAEFQKAHKKLPAALKTEITKLRKTYDKIK